MDGGEEYRSAVAYPLEAGEDTKGLGEDIKRLVRMDGSRGEAIDGGGRTTNRPPYMQERNP